MVKLCECGCGEPTRIAVKTQKDRGHVKGQPLRFINGHYVRVRPVTDQMRAKCSAANKGRPKSPEHRAKLSGENHHSWKGGRFVDGDGYVRILARGNPMAYADGYALEHRVVMSKHLGRPLTTEEVVHHVNEDKADNRIGNLMLFANDAEHTAHHESLRRAA